MFNPKDFENVLTKVLKADQGIKKAILVDRTGLTVAHVSRFSYYASDADSIGVIASAVFCASEEQGSSLNIGSLNIVTSEFDTGKIFAVSTGRGVLCVITDPSINLGIIRLVMRRASKDLAEKLDTFLTSQGSMIGSPTDVSMDNISGSPTPSGGDSGAPTISPMNKDELEAALKELEKF